MLAWLFAVVIVEARALGSPAPASRRLEARIRRAAPLRMGFFDGFAKAFSNQDFAREDARIRASHILTPSLADSEAALAEVKAGAAFADVARRTSACASRTKGGDLGLFGRGKMVAEFDDALFPNVDAPPVGAILGPLKTRFGYHVILVTERGKNKDQVTELLARND
ncbi:hypothetical protein M885DRAFT_521643 [Pelagophyceae sp. CCMP2097]|nr:hypothetical protein M885DRAFT_521643 [Pelagophyceae sp. CCMP2097]|mmetsp:Transcript_7002/g.22734  ORF Transcript_7002/g.22734 Transcript_7002/m.22734 type:complete len:167 (+) Transcript_7002:228-728(+)